MEHINRLTEVIVERKNDERLGEIVRYSARAYAVDLAKMLKNIRDTSIGTSDRRDRLVSLANECGITYSELEFLC